MLSLLQRIIEIDHTFNDEFDDMIQAIEGMCVGVNEGLHIELYKLREKFFFLQLGVYRDAIPEPPKPRGPGEPETRPEYPIIHLIKLFNKKAELLTQMAQHFHSDKYTGKSRESDADVHGDVDDTVFSHHVFQSHNTKGRGSSSTPTKLSKVAKSSHQVKAKKIVITSQDWETPQELKTDIQKVDLSSIDLNSSTDFDSFF